MAPFDSLSDADFEELVGDLLTARLGLEFRAGARGSDAGVDLVAYDATAAHVVQCKHFRSSTFSHLKTAARHESEKLRALAPRPASYRLVTSLALSHARVRQVQAALDAPPGVATEVLAQADLRRLLRQHAEVE